MVAVVVSSSVVVVGEAVVEAVEPAVVVADGVVEPAVVVTDGVGASVVGAAVVGAAVVAGAVVCLKANQTRGANE